jgi:hypothetical protein
MNYKGEYTDSQFIEFKKKLNKSRLKRKSKIPVFTPYSLDLSLKISIFNVRFKRKQNES